MTEQKSGPDLSVGVEQDTVAVSFDTEGKSTVTTTGDGIRQDYGSDGELLTPEDIASLEADPDGEAAGKAEGDASGDAEDDKSEGDDKEEGAEEGVELPDWDPESEEVSTAYDSKYITTDDEGKDVLNFEAFNAEFALDRGEGKRDLNPGTRRYLKDRFGISDALIDSHLKGVIAQEREMEADFHKQFGSTPEDGKRNFDAMFAWATSEAGYTPEQKARYNEAMAAGGQAALDQIELLKTRYLSKNGGKLPEGETSETGKQSGIGLKRKERGVSPPKNATGGQTTTPKQAAPFANAEEHRVAQNEALKLTGKARTSKLEEVRSRLLVSDFWRK